MIGRARLVAASRKGVTFPEVLESQAPLALRVTASPGPVLNVSLLHTGAGYFEDDRTSIEIEVRQNACVCISTPGSSIAFPCKGSGWSAAEVSAIVRTGGFLAWLPEALIATDTCRHHVRTRVNLAKGAAVLWREEVIAGRNGETGGRLELTFSANLAGRPLFRDAVVFGPEGWTGPRTLAGNRFTGSVALLGRRMAEAPGVMQLAGTGSLARAVEPDALALRRALDRYAGAPAIIQSVYGKDANETGNSPSRTRTF